MTGPFSSSFDTPIHSSAAMRDALDDRARLQRMLDFEVALARAQAAVGIVPALALDHIATAARAERYDLASLAQAATACGNTAFPAIEALRAEVAKADPPAARYVHWGATDQDLIDSALVLDLRAAIDVLLVDLNRAVEGFLALSGRHRRTATIARAARQRSAPMPFGLKVAGYAAALARSRERLRRLRREALVLQFGGTAGTLAAFSDKGIEVAERLAALLDLTLPEAPWHGYGDRLAEIAAAFAILAGTCGKIGRDISLLMQPEIGEVLEPAASERRGAPNPPHTRSSAAAGPALAAATVAPNLLTTILTAQVQEDAYGNWQTERPIFPALALITSGGLGAIADIAQRLEVDKERMRANLEATRGLVMAEAVLSALAAKIGPAEAESILEEVTGKAAATKRDLQDLLLAHDRAKLSLSIGELAKLFEPLSYQGVAQTFIDRIVGVLQARPGKR
jgi:3-carboxy-cis,cis-muconate cycloisomerase